MKKFIAHDTAMMVVVVVVNKNGVVMTNGYIWPFFIFFIFETRKENKNLQNQSIKLLLLFGGFEFWFQRKNIEKFFQWSWNMLLWWKQENNNNNNNSPKWNRKTKQQQQQKMIYETLIITCVSIASFQIFLLFQITERSSSKTFLNEFCSEFLWTNPDSEHENETLTFFLFNIFQWIIVEL